MEMIRIDAIPRIDNDFQKKAARRAGEAPQNFASILLEKMRTTAGDSGQSHAGTARSRI